MPRLIVLILIASLIAACTHDTQTADNKVENFDTFWQKFTSDADFQLERIKFPIRNKVYNTDTENYDSLMIRKDEWKYSDFSDVRFIKTQKKESARRYVLNIQIDETGVYVDYIFELINGKWFLTIIVDGST